MKSDIEQLFENAGVSLPNENSLGEKIVPDDDPVKLANFWNWFGDSKCVNKYNEPLVVYHGTGFEFNSFKTDRPIFFSDNIDVAKWFCIYGKGDAMHRNMHKAYLLMNNPLVIDANKSIFGDIQYNENKFSAEDIANYAKKNGYDSVIIKNVKEAAYEEILCNDFIVFSNNQIKSIKNNGNFSGSDNIYESIEYAEMFEDGNMFEVHKNPSDKEFWDLMRNSRYKKLRALVSVDEKERVCFVWDAYYGGTHNDILGKYLVKYNQNMSHYAQLYCTEKGIEVFGFCPEWFKETYYKSIYSKDEIENISKALQDIFDDDDLGLLK